MGYCGALFEVRLWNVEVGLEALKRPHLTTEGINDSYQITYENNIAHKHHPVVFHVSV